MEVVMDEEIRNAIELEIRRLNEEEEDIKNAMEVEIKRFKEEEELEEKKLMEEKEIRVMRFKFVIHVSPLKIIDHYHTAAGHVLAENKIELVIDVIDHHYIYQYWSPPLKTRLGDSSSTASLCQHHDYHHPRDDDDEDMILTSCRPLCDPPRRIKIVTLLDQGVFAAAESTDDGDEHIISTTTLLGDLDVLFSEYQILSTQEHLHDVKTGIARRICEAKTHVLSRGKPPKRIRICVDVSWAAKKYYASAEAATFVSAMDTATDASISMDIFCREALPWILLQRNIMYDDIFTEEYPYIHV